MCGPEQNVEQQHKQAIQYRQHPSFQFKNCLRTEELMEKAVVYNAEASLSARSCVLIA